MSERPLFQGMDEKERELAPEQVPDAQIPPEELDVGGSAGQGPAVAAAEGGGHEPETEAGRANIAGAEGDQRTAPVVGVRPDVSANTPVFTPATPGTAGTDEPDATTERRNQA
ncbi:hypothetical protein [Kallotenue papyrolyticum]|uniref:hypothetical protein n=1 Tax=Kallotenue papyrolyticum TaxID=1325125 RepID=UPI0004929012|nr:hypothetical protein [Kallotenue papyrolyticum]